MVRHPSQAGKRRDGGSVLILTLILTVVLAVVVLALATYATTGVRASSVPTERTDGNADAAAALNYVIERFAAKDWTIDLDCNADVPSSVPLSIPDPVRANESSVEVSCAEAAQLSSEPVIYLVATANSPGFSERRIEALVEIPTYSYGSRVADWRVDIPIAAQPPAPPPPPGPPGNTPPTANTVNVTTTATAAVTFVVNASDAETPADQLVVEVDPVYQTLHPSWTVDIVPIGREVTITPPQPPEASAPDGNYEFSYRVSDGSLSSLWSTITVTIDPLAPPPPPAPAPGCRFEIATIQGGGNRGRGTLTITNAGGAFTGWAVDITSNGWAFTFDDPTVTNLGPSYRVESTASNESIATGPSSLAVNAANLNAGPPSAKVTVGQTFGCAVVVPVP